MNLLFKAAGFLLLFSFLLFLIVRLFENRLVFFPAKYPEGQWGNPDRWPPRVDKHFESGDGTKLHGWFFPRESAQKHIIFLHGNAGNISYRLDLIERLMNQIDCDLFIFDYRGYGKSKGSPDEKGVYADAEAAYRFAMNNLGFDPAKTIIYGRSLGGAIAVDLATKVASAGLLLESTFSNAEDMAKSMYGIIPVGYLTGLRFDSLSKIKKVNIPKLFIHGTDDHVVPYALGQKLYNAAPAWKRFLEIEGGSHNDTYLIQPDNLYYDAIRDFTIQAITAYNKK